MPLRKFENRNEFSCLSLASKFHDSTHKPERNRLLRPFAKEFDIFHVQMYEIFSIPFFTLGVILRAERLHSSTCVAFKSFSVKVMI